MYRVDLIQIFIYLLNLKENSNSGARTKPIKNATNEYSNFFIKYPITPKIITIYKSIMVLEAAKTPVKQVYPTIE